MAVNESSNILNENDSELVNRVRDYSRLFEVKIEIRVFGRLVWSIIWPPKNGGSNV